MTQPLVEQWGAKHRRGKLAPGQPREHLLESEQFEVVDQEGARERRPPAGPVHRLQRERGAALDLPHGAGDRPPLRKQQDQHAACQQHAGAALDGFGHETCPPALERRPCHHAVLDREAAEQQQVDDERLGQRAFGGNGRQADVDRLGRRQVADKRDGAEARPASARLRPAPARGVPPLQRRRSAGRTPCRARARRSGWRSPRRGMRAAVAAGASATRRAPLRARAASRPGCAAGTARAAPGSTGSPRTTRPAHARSPRQCRFHKNAAPAPTWRRSRRAPSTSASAAPAAPGWLCPGPRSPAGPWCRSGS